MARLVQILQVQNWCLAFPPPSASRVEFLDVLLIPFLDLVFSFQSHLAVVTVQPASRALFRGVAVSTSLLRCCALFGHEPRRASWTCGVIDDGCAACSKKLRMTIADGRSLSSRPTIPHTKHVAHAATAFGLFCVVQNNNGKTSKNLSLSLSKLSTKVCSACR